MEHLDQAQMEKPEWMASGMMKTTAYYRQPQANNQKTYPTAEAEAGTRRTGKPPA